MREEILKTLDKNSKVAESDLAKMLGMTEEEVHAEIKKLEAEHVICGYPTLINWDATTEERVTALIEVKVTPQRGQGFDKIAERIYRYDEVESVYLMSGGFDLMVIVNGRTFKDVSLFVARRLSTLESVVSTATHFVLQRYKDRDVLFLQDEQDERGAI